jgi:uncharacterized membrane protein YgcG
LLQLETPAPKLNTTLATVLEVAVNQKAMLMAPPKVRVPKLMEPVDPSNFAAPEVKVTPPDTVPFHVPVLSVTAELSSSHLLVMRPQGASSADGSGGGGRGGGGLGGGGLGGGGGLVCAAAGAAANSSAAAT